MKSYGRDSVHEVFGVALLVGVASALAALFVALMVELLSAGSVRW
jgi:hypothetical protein